MNDTRIVIAARGHSSCPSLYCVERIRDKQIVFGPTSYRECLEWRANVRAAQDKRRERRE